MSATRREFLRNSGALLVYFSLPASAAISAAGALAQAIGPTGNAAFTVGVSHFSRDWIARDRTVESRQYKSIGQASSTQLKTETTEMESNVCHGTKETQGWRTRSVV